MTHDWAAQLRTPGIDPAALAAEAARTVDALTLIAALEAELQGDLLHQALEAAAKGAPGAPARIRYLRALAARTEASAANRALWCGELATQLEDLDRLEEAIEALEHAIENARAVPDAASEARLLNRLGTLLHSRGESARALDAYEHSLHLKETAGDLRGAWNTLFNLATLQRELGEPQTAYETAQRALRATEGDARRTAQTLTLIAHATLEAKIPTDTLQRAWDAYHALGDTDGKAALLVEQASIHERLGARDAARFRLSQLPTEGVSSGIASRAQALGERLGTAGRPLLERVLEINRALLSRRDAAALVREIVDAAIELVSAERGFCILTTESDFHVAAARHFSRDPIRQPEFQVSRGVATWVTENAHPVLTAQAGEDPSLRSFRSLEQLNVQSLCCVPMHAGEHVLGALYVDHRLRTNAFSKDDLATLQALADQAALALTHARLLEENARQEKALEQANAQLRLANRGLQERVREQSRIIDAAPRAGRDRYDQLVGRSAAMQEVYRLLDKLESSEETVLIHGETGTGKELLARGIHNRSRRQSAPFVAINCGALPETLLESELFGHVKGAFTGAASDRSGVFEQAQGGTLFLDEVGEISPETQKKLLRVLQEKEIRRVGDNHDRKVNVRVIAATNRDLTEAVQEKTFREDLYYRLNVLRIELPPLRDRREDIPDLVQHFLERIAIERGGEKPMVSAELLKRLQAHRWPGNVRELENAVRRIVALGEEALDLETTPPPATATPDTLRTLEEVELEHIKRVLHATGGNVTEAARILGVGSATLWRRLRKHDLRPEA